MTIEKLKELEREATKEPWKWLPPELRDGEGPIDRLISGAGTPVCDFGDCTQHYPICGAPPSGTDRALIATLRNLAPELIAVVEAAQALPDWGDNNIVFEGETMSIVTPKLLEKVHDAITALHAKLAQEQCP